MGECSAVFNAIFGPRIEFPNPLSVSLGLPAGLSECVSLLAVYGCWESIVATVYFVVINISVKTDIERIFTKFIIPYRAMNRVSHRAPAL